MKSGRHGADISAAELAEATAEGIHLIVDGNRYYLALSDFPWFRNASTAQLATIERPDPDHLRWPELDVDLSLGSIARPQDFPLMSAVERSS